MGTVGCPCRDIDGHRVRSTIQDGATCRDRTDDLMITNQLLYQLS